jgi:hypothetical protein
MPAQAVDRSKVHRENALRRDAHYAAGIDAITDYDGTDAAAESHGY